MRLGAYTLIEGIVSMVLLSILLSVAVIVSFNLYRSFPSQGEILQRNVLEQELDSLVLLQVTEPTSYFVRGYFASYSTSGFYDLENVRIGTCVLADSLDRELTAQKVFYISARNEK